MEGYPCLLLSGAPDSLVRHQTSTVACPVRDFLPNRAQPTVAPPGQMAHRTLFGAHRTVRCTQPTVGASHVSRVDRVADHWRWCRWLTGQSGELYPRRLVPFPESDEFVADDSPDSPVHHRTVR
jgi:hypothetical protein